MNDGELQEARIDLGAFRPDTVNGTVVITLSRNHIDASCACARSLGVGRVAAGVDRAAHQGHATGAGADRSSLAISAAAAMTGTDGWQTAMTWTSGPERSGRISMT